MLRSIGILLLVLGLAGLLYGLFGHDDTVAKADLGPVQVEVEDRDRSHPWLWAGALGLVAGTALLIASRRRS